MFLFHYVDDESLDIYFNGELMVSVNHDEDGWAGMEKVRTAFERMSHQIGVAIRIKGDPNV